MLCSIPVEQGNAGVPERMVCAYCLADASEDAAVYDKALAGG